MSIVQRHLQHTVTHWPNNGSDGFGGYTYGSPVTLAGRWEERSVLFKTQDNEEAVSAAIVFLASNVAIGDYLAEGDYTDVSDPTSISDSWEVRQFHRNTDLRNTETIRKAYL